MIRSSRREYLKTIGAVGVGLGVTTSVADAQRNFDDKNVKRIEETTVTVEKGTNVAVTPSPDSESLIMDLHGFLFRVPMKGGEANQLTDIDLEPARPDYAPDGNRIAFQSYKEGNYQIWMMDLEDGNTTQLTDHGFFDDRDPRWSPDGSQIAFSSDRGENYDIWTIDVETGDLQQWTDNPDENFAPTWSPDGSEIAYVADEETKIKAINQDGETRTLISVEKGDTLDRPSWSPDGEDIAYVRRRNNEIDLMISEEQLTDGEDVFVFTPYWLSTDEILYTADGNIRRLDLNSGEPSDVPFSTTFELPEIEYERKSYDFDDRTAREVKGILAPTISPDSEKVAFIALNDLWVMSIGQPPRRITNDSFYQADPAWSRDGRYLAYSSDKAGTQDLYIHDMQTKDKHQVTSLDDASVAAAWSPDDSKIAFQNQDGVTLVLEIEIDEEVNTDEIREVTDEIFAPSRPTWSADGKTLALTRLKQYSDRFRSGTNQYMTVNIETGETNLYPPGEEFDSVSSRQDDGPVWSPDGNWMAFVVERTLHVMPVNETGEPTGPAEQITDEATDAPSWSGDSEWLLYLNNGRLKKVRRDGSETQEVPVRGLHYRRNIPSGRCVIHVGRMWDGTSPEIHEDVNITVVNNRIQNISSNCQPPRHGRYIDASDLTVIPGLWDSHVHVSFESRMFGDRMGRILLAYGITTAYGMGDLAYHAIEHRESWRSGERIGPRFFASGELLDGSRVYYELLSPVRSSEQLQLEMARAQELDYDLTKMYVRLRTEHMREATEISHEELGAPAASHYLAPGAFLRQDGTGHLSGTQKLDFDRTESETSQTYNDVIELYGQGERSLDTTFFTTSTFILADDIADDPRMQLFPPWRRESLRSTAEDTTEFPSDPDCETGDCRNANTMGNIMDQGGIVRVGSDMSGDYEGVGLHANLRPLVHYDAMSPYEALLSATRIPAEFQGVEDDLGTLEPRKLADMAFIDGNPLENIEEAIQVRMTMKNGELFTPEDLLEPFSAEKDH